MFPVAVPAPGLSVVTVTNVGPVSFVKVTDSPSGSVPEIARSVVPPGATRMSGNEMVGCRFEFAMVSVVEVLLNPPLSSVTVQTMWCVPASKYPGAPEIVAFRGDGPGASAVNVRSAGIPDWVIVSVRAASGSVAVALIVEMGTPSVPEAGAGALPVGGVPTADWTPSQSNQSPAIPLVVPQGSEGLPST